MDAIIDIERESDLQMIAFDFKIEVREVEFRICFPEAVKFIAHFGCGSMYLGGNRSAEAWKNCGIFPKNQPGKE
jgi:hypothetical protein